MCRNPGGERRSVVMSRWMFEAVLRAVVTPLLLASLGHRAFAIAAVVGVAVGWAAVVGGPLAGAVDAIVAVAACAWWFGGSHMPGSAADAGAAFVPTMLAFGVLKAGQAALIAQKSAGTAWQPGSGWRIAAVAGGGVAALADSGLVGLAAIGFAIAWLAPQRTTADAPAHTHHTAGFSRLTYRSGIVLCAALTTLDQTVSFAIAFGAAHFLLDGVARTARLLHPNQAEAGRALHIDRPIRRFQRAVDGTMLVASGVALLLGLYTAPLMLLALDLRVQPGLGGALAAVVVASSVAFAIGQWLGRETGMDTLARTLGYEAVLAVVTAAGLGVLWGAAGIAWGVALAIALVSARSFAERAQRRLAVGRSFVLRRLGTAALAALPALAMGTTLDQLHPVRTPTDLATALTVTAVLHLVSAVAWWTLAARRGL